MCSRWRGSMPLNGSSSSRIRGSWTSAPASLARWRMPLEYVPIGRSAASVRSTVAIARAAASSGSATPWRRALSRANSQPGQVRRGRPRAPGRGRCARYIVGPPPGRLRPRPGPRPADGASSPAMRWSRVDLPAPLGPSRPVTPGPRRERDVVDRDDVAVPARDVVELERGRDGRRPGRRLAPTGVAARRARRLGHAAIRR